MKMSMLVLFGVAISLYLCFMFIEPFLNNGTNGLIQVLKDWQTLNAAFIALFASVIALYATQYNVIKQKERDFIASKAFLPEALSELTEYLESSSKLLLEAYKRESDQADTCKTPLEEELPTLPKKYRVTFRECIHSGEYEISEYLSEILRDLQIHNSRMVNTYQEFSDLRTFIRSPSNKISEIYELAKIYSRIGRLYPFARNEERLDNSSIKRDEMINTFSNLDIDDIDSLMNELLKRL